MRYSDIHVELEIYIAHAAMTYCASFLPKCQTVVMFNIRDYDHDENALCIEVTGWQDNCYSSSETG